MTTTPAMPEPFAWAWRNKVTGAKGVYFEDPKPFGITSHPDYEWTNLYTEAQPIATLQAQPAADWQTPTTYAQRFTEAVALLCREIPPADMVAGWIDRASDDHRLQDWACERAPAWAQGIGLLDAAHVMADQPTEGVDHEPAQPAEVSDGWTIDNFVSKA